jgi:hypothetical protein
MNVRIIKKCVILFFQERREREQEELEYAKEMADDEDDF